MFFRLQRNVIGLEVHKDDNWLRLEKYYFDERYDSINTLVMRYVITAVAIPIGDHEVLACFQYPVHSSKYYK